MDEDGNKQLVKTSLKGETITQEQLLLSENPVFWYAKANDKDEAFDISLDKGGINFDRIDKLLTNEDFQFCETTYVDAEPGDTDIEYKGTIIKDTDDDIKCDYFEPEFKDTIVPFNKKFGRHI